MTARSPVQRPFNWREFLSGLSALLIVLGITATIVWFVLNQVRRLDSEVAAAVITASATVVVSVVVVVLGRYFEKKRELEAQAREQKIPLYEEFIEFWFRVLYAEKLGEDQPSERDLLRVFVDFTRKSTVWASDAVIRRWRDVRLRYVDLGSQAPKQSTDSVMAMFSFEELLLEMRKDTGHPKTRLKRGDLLGLFIDDIDQYMDQLDD